MTETTHSDELRQEHAVDHAASAPAPVTLDTSASDGPGGEPAPPQQTPPGAGAHSHGLVPGQPVKPALTRGDRKPSFDLADFPLPGGREEEWRFTPIDRLRGLLDGAPSDAHLGAEVTLAEGVTWGGIAAGDPALTAVPAPADRLAALALANSNGAAVLRIPAEAELGDPTVLRFSGTGETVWGHVVIEVGRHARATVVLEYTGSARLAAGVSVLVGDGAQLNLVSIQDWAEDAVHSAHVGIRLGRDAAIRSTQVTLGGDLVRIVETVEYDGPGGDAELAGVYFADAGQHLEHRLFVDHAVPNCRSNVVYKGALQGENAHTVWIGDVLIRAEAEGTDTYELNRNLVLDDGPRADSVPNLEIETGEIVGAGHASATGRFDDEQLFYLQARGIPEEQARRLVVRGFFAEVVQRIGVAEIEERLMAAIEAELENTMTTPADNPDTPDSPDEGDRS